MKSITLLFLPILIIFSSVNKANAQKVITNESGVVTTKYGQLITIYDPFTDELVIGTDGFLITYEASNDTRFKMMPLFQGTKSCSNDICGDFGILITLEDSSVIEYFNMTGNNIIDLLLTKSYPILYDNERDEIDLWPVDIEEMRYILMGKVNLVSEPSGIYMPLKMYQYSKLVNSKITRIRIQGTVVEFGENVRSYFSKVEDILKTITEQDVSNLNDGNVDSSQSSYELKWEGEIDRSPMVQSLPENTSTSEAVITVRFEVRPDGTVGRIIPLRKMNPEMEREVMSTLRTWQFSRLPGGVPQQTQWGTITFRFLGN